MNSQKYCLILQEFLPYAKLTFARRLGPTTRRGDVSDVKVHQRVSKCEELCSPDLSPIEFIWKLVKDKVEKKDPKIKNTLSEYIETAAGEISTQIRVNLMNSLPLRFGAYIEAKGDVIKS